MAGRIPQDFIDDLLNRTDIADVVEERISLKRTGRNYSGLCPFHQEKTPSFSVNPEKQFYYCFGCGAGGNALGFVMEYDRIDFPQAVDTLARRIGLEVPKEAGSNEPRNQKLNAAYDLLERSASFYQQQLRQHPQRQKAVDYLKGRGLSGRIAQRFQIGYAPPGWDNLISQLEKELSDVSREAMDDAGLVILKSEENKCYDRFRDRIIFPIVDMRGRVIAFGGRVLTDEKPKYLNSPETDTFHKNRELYGLYQARQANRELRRILIVEGYMDVVALAQFEITNAVATLGTATSEHHLNRIFKLVSEVVFCFDGDSAGRKAAKRALETTLPLMEDGRQARFLFLPEGEDPDSVVRQEGSDGFNQRVSNARSLSDFFFDSCSEELDLHSGEGRARLSSIAMPMIEKIPGQVFRQLMKQQLSEMTGLSSDFFDQMEPPQMPAAAPEPADWPAPDYDAPPPAMMEDWGEYHQEPAEPPSWQQDNEQSGSFRKEGYRKKGRFRDFRNDRPQPVIRPSSLGRRAIKSLLHFPRLALKVGFEITETFAELKDPELDLLCRLIEQLRNDPQTQPALILLEWQGDPNFDTLQEIIEQELLITETETMESEFIDGLQQLVTRKKEETELDYLKRKNSSSLTAEEKQRLNELLLRPRSGQR